MMSWKSPPKALHSFSIPASIFPQAGKKILKFPTRKLFTPLQKSKIKHFQESFPTEESTEDFNLMGEERKHPEGKVHL